MEGLRSEWTVKIVAIVMILFGKASTATNHTVGGISGWDLTSNLQNWTSETTFHVGDSLVFSYTPVHDVVEVNQDDYQSCVSSNPITTHNDGESVVTLTRPGTRYFICGRQGYCQMGLKVQVQVQVQAQSSEDQARPNKRPSPAKRAPPPKSNSPPDDGPEWAQAPSRQARRCGPVNSALCLVEFAVIMHVLLFWSFLPS